LVGLAREFLPLPPALPAPEAERRPGEGRADQPPRPDEDLARYARGPRRRRDRCGRDECRPQKPRRNWDRSPQQKPAPDSHQDEDATVKVADGIARWLLHRPLSEDKKPLAGNLVHYAFGGSIGAIYGGVAVVAPRVTAAVGLPFGVAVWLGAHVITVPALGLAEPPTRQPRSKEGLEFALHLVHGAVTELVRRLAHRVL
jgi:hypothetical protein